MGVETLIGVGTLLGGGAAVYGAHEAHKGRKSAEREASKQFAHQQEQEGKLAVEQDRLSKEAMQQRKLLNQGIARSGRRRIRGGLFGDSETAGNVSSTLG